MQHELQDLWQTIHHCLSVQAPEILHRLQPGATDEQFQHAEAFFHLSLPEEVKALYRLHNGATRYGVTRFISPPDRSFEAEVEPYKRSTSELFLDWWCFHSLEVLCERWETLEAEGYPPLEERPAFDHFLEHEAQEGSVQFLSQAAFYPLHWHARWLPFMTGRQGYYFIDLMPGPKGNIGQILFVPPTDDIREGIAHVVASSLSEFFTQVAHDLSAGSYVFDDSTGLFLSKEGWLVTRTWYPSEREELWQARKTFLGRNDLAHPDALPSASPEAGRERLFGMDRGRRANELQATWDRVVVVLDQRASALSHVLRPGATEMVFQQAEALLNIRLPDEVKQFYAYHNGLRWKNGLVHYSEHVVNGWSVHSLDTLCSLWIGLFDVYLWSNWKKKNEIRVEEGLFSSPIRAIQAVFWHPCWLPFMVRWYSENGVSHYQHYYIDLVPGPDGQYGQILFAQVKSEPDVNSFLYGTAPDSSKIHRSVPQVVAPSLSVFFAHFAEDLEAGRYRYDAATRMLWSRAEWDAASKRGDLERYWRNRKTSFGEGQIPLLTSQWDLL